MNTCKDCRFWGQPKTLQVQCRCRHEALDGIDWANETNALFVDAWDKAGIYTGPDFGCIHWTAKP